MSIGGTIKTLAFRLLRVLINFRDEMAGRQVLSLPRLKMLPVYTFVHGEKVLRRADNIVDTNLTSSSQEWLMHLSCLLCPEETTDLGQNLTRDYRRKGQEGSSEILTTHYDFPSCLVFNPKSYEGFNSNRTM